MKLYDKVSILTGASGGLGSEILHLLLKKGVKCHVLIKDESKIKKLYFYEQYKKLIN